MNNEQENKRQKDMDELRAKYPGNSLYSSKANADWLKILKKWEKEERWSEPHWFRKVTMETYTFKKHAEEGGTKWKEVKVEKVLKIWRTK